MNTDILKETGVLIGCHPECVLAVKTHTVCKAHEESWLMAGRGLSYTMISQRPVTEVTGYGLQSRLEAGWGVVCLSWLFQMVHGW